MQIPVFLLLGSPSCRHFVFALAIDFRFLMTILVSFAQSQGLVRVSRPSFWTPLSPLALGVGWEGRPGDQGEKEELKQRILRDGILQAFQNKRFPAGTEVDLSLALPSSVHSVSVRALGTTRWLGIPAVSGGNSVS